MHVANQRQFSNEAFVRFTERKLFCRIKNVTENWYQHIQQIILLLLLVFPVRSKLFTWLKWNPHHPRILFVRFKLALGFWRQQFGQRFLKNASCLRWMYCYIFQCFILKHFLSVINFLAIHVSISVELKHQSSRNFGQHRVIVVQLLIEQSAFSCTCQYRPLLDRSIEKFLNDIFLWQIFLKKI